MIHMRNGKEKRVIESTFFVRTVCELTRGWVIEILIVLTRGGGGLSYTVFKKAFLYGVFLI